MPALLSSAGFDVWEYYYDTCQSIDRYEDPWDSRNDEPGTAEGLRSALVEVTQHTGGPSVKVVGHSMGGVISRAAIELCNAAGLVNRLITIGAPHLGTATADLVSTNSAVDIRNNSALLSQLSEVTPAALAGPQPHYVFLAGVDVYSRLEWVGDGWTQYVASNTREFTTEVAEPTDGVVRRSSAQAIGLYSTAVRPTALSRYPHSSMDVDAELGERAQAAPTRDGASDHLMYQEILRYLRESIADPGLGLVAHWPLNGNAIDDTGNGNDGTTYWTAPVEGQLGLALAFDGVRSEIAVTAGQDLQNVTAGPHSYSAWVYLTEDIGAYPDGAFIVDALGPGPSWAWYWDQRGLRIQGGNTPCLKWVTTANSYQGCASTGMDLLNWHHIAGVFDGGQGRVYVDGNPLGEWASEGTSTRTTEWKIGNVSAGGTGLGFFPGRIDDVRVYGRALTAAEVRELYLLR